MSGALGLPPFTTSMSISSMFARESSVSILQDSRPIKRQRIDDLLEASQDRGYDFVPTPAYEPALVPQDSPHGEGAKKAHSKKQPLSCAECRRLKLKCDRVWPCQSCLKRGCAQICPQGALTSGKGSRFILANTEELHSKIAEMSDRIQQLEDAVATMQPSLSSEPHPLLHPDLLRIKSSAELHRAQMTGSTKSAPSPPDEHSEGEPSRNLTPSALPQEHAYDFRAAPDTGPIISRTLPGDGPVDLPADIIALSQAFPVPWPINILMIKRLRDLLPPRPQAEQLCEQAQRTFLWQHKLDPSETFLPNLLNHVYTSPIDSLGSRRLALLYMIMAIGLQFDITQPVDSPQGEAYHHLARVALCETPIMEHPDMDLMHNLFYMIWYLLVFSDKNNAGIYAWSMLGLATKLAQALGLHRGSSGWKDIPEETERRRFLMWELIALDARLSLSLGRPPSFNIKHIDCQRPSYDVEHSTYATKPMRFIKWKHDFFEACTSPVIEATALARPVPYSHVLTLDSSIRDFPMPPELDMFGPDGLSTEKTLLMQQALASAGRQIVLLQLHRNYFTQCLNGPAPFSFSHPYAPSVAATYTSACRLIAGFELVVKNQPLLCKRIFGFWFNVFSAAVAVCFFVARAPHAAVAASAVREMQKIRPIFAEISKDNPRAARASTLLNKLVEKSSRIYHQFVESGGYSETLEVPNVGLNRAQLATSDTRSQLEPESRAEPDPFENAHPSLKVSMFKSKSTTDAADPCWIPAADISLTEQDYRDGSFTTPSPVTTSYIPSRVGNQSLNFDFGALALGPDDQSLMTWF